MQFILCGVLLITNIILFYMYRKVTILNKELQAANATTRSQRTSSEVRLGKIGENMAPFLNGWPYEPGYFRFLGNPVDGIQFNEDSIIIMEIKTGNARLSKGQKRIKELIQQGEVYFETFRIDEDGCTLRRDGFVKMNELKSE